MLSANVGSPICSCQRETGSCEVRIVERTWYQITVLRGAHRLKFAAKTLKIRQRTPHGRQNSNRRDAESQRSCTKYPGTNSGREGLLAALVPCASMGAHERTFS